MWRLGRQAARIDSKIGRQRRARGYVGRRLDNRRRRTRGREEDSWRRCGWWSTKMKTVASRRRRVERRAVKRITAWRVRVLAREWEREREQWCTQKGVWGVLPPEKFWIFRHTRFLSFEAHYQMYFHVDATSSGRTTLSFFNVCSECIPTGTTLPLQGSEAGNWLENVRTSQGTPGCCRASEWKLSTIFIALVTKILRTVSQCSTSLVLRLVAHGLPHTASCVCTLSSWIQHSIPSISSLRSGNFQTLFIFLGSRSWQKCTVSHTVRTCMQIPCTQEAPFSSRLSRNSCGQLSESTKHSETQSWRHGSGCGIILEDQHRHAPTRRVRACEKVRCPDDCPFQVSSLWRSRGWVQEEDSNPRDTQRLLLIRPETSIWRVQVVLDAAGPRCHSAL